MDADRLAAMSLDEFRAEYERDDNAWWYLDGGHHQNLFDEACAELERLQAENALLRDLIQKDVVTSVVADLA